MTNGSPLPTLPAGPGRPRGFDLDKALDEGIALFRAHGFDATSLDALTKAMGISRSSFYAAFGSKHGVLVAALERYSATRLARLEAVATGPEPTARILEALAGGIGPDGCMMVNCLTELCPLDLEITRLGTRHIDAIEAILARGLPAESREMSGALIALALGAHTLRKAGRSPDAIAALIGAALSRLAPPG